MQQNETAAGALPRTLLGQLTALPKTPRWFQGEGKEGEVRGREREKRAGREVQTGLQMG